MTLTADRLQEIVGELRGADGDVDAALRVESLTTQDIADYLDHQSWHDNVGTYEDGRDEHTVWLAEGDVAEIVSWVDVDVLMTTECEYCSAEVRRSTDPVPAVTDDAAWAALAREHGVGCPWVDTRAHRWTRTLSASEAADILGVTRRSVYNYYQAGRFSSAWETPGGQLRVPEHEVQALRREPVRTGELLFPDGHVSATEPGKTVITFTLKAGERSGDYDALRLIITEIPGMPVTATIQRDGRNAEREDFQSVTEAIDWGRSIQADLAD